MLKNNWRPSGLLVIVILVLTGFAWVLFLAFHSTSGHVAKNFSYEFGSFGTVQVKSPQQATEGVVLLVSDMGGPDDRDAGITASLNRIGFAVVGISLPEMRKKWKVPNATCLSFVNSVDSLSKDVQHRTDMKSYLQPVIAGIGEGGVLAYIVNQQSAKGLFKSTVSIDFTPHFQSVQPLCLAKTSERSRTPDWELLPVKSVPAPWLVIALANSSTKESAVSISGFVGAVQNAQLVVAKSVAGKPMPTAVISKAFEPMLQTASTLLSDALASLPITEITVAGAPVTDTMAVFYSGDGGWTGLNQQITTDLAKQGVPTIGISSLKYFWSAQTPDSAAQDLQRIIQTYGQRWHRKKVIIIGYSFGADVLPFIYAALPPDSQSQIVRLSLLGLSDKADFQFHLGSWLDISGDDAMPTVPQISGLTGVNVQCIRGTTEQDNACPGIAAGKAEQITLPGDHHFNGNASLIAQTFLTGLPL